MRRSRIAAVVIAFLALGHLWTQFSTLRGWVMRHQESPAARGRALAGDLGCFACHGPDGRGGVPNPGSRWETVPGFGEQTLMMFVENDQEVREYILDGAPERKRGSETYREQMAAQALQMPPYRGWVSDAEIEALIAYLRSASGMLTPAGGAEARGAQLAAEYNCFGCHGEMGAGGRSNPGSLKGYIPGFYGHDFSDLVRSDEELVTWIATGSLERVTGNPIGRYFFERQRIQMPAYRKLLTEEQIADLAVYVRWLSDGSWRAASLNP